jgi:hypothetical protein
MAQSSARAATLMVRSVERGEGLKMRSVEDVMS